MELSGEQEIEYIEPNTWSFNATNLTVAIKIGKIFGYEWMDEGSRGDLKV